MPGKPNYVVSNITLAANTWTPILANSRANFFVLTNTSEHAITIRTRVNDARSEWTLDSGVAETCLVPYTPRYGMPTRFAPNRPIFFAYAPEAPATMLLKMVR